MTTFETGANTAQANDLVLSLINDGEAYTDRLHCGYAMLQGSTHRMSFRDLVSAEAAKQRRQFKSKFSAAHISEAAKIVQSQTLEHCIESIRDSWNGEKIQCDGRKWWDSTNGNTYCSARISVPTVSGVRWVSIPMDYGYGDHWKTLCVQTLQRMGFVFPEKALQRELPIDFTGGEYGKKSALYQGIYIKGL